MSSPYNPLVNLLPSLTPRCTHLLLAAFLVTAAPTALAQITIDTDSDSVLSGSFSLTSDAFESLSPSAFEALPGGSGQTVDFFRDTFFDEVSIFPSGLVFAGDDPAFASGFTGGVQNFTDITGVYDVNSDGPTVAFRYTNLTDTGGVGGTFSGNFEFVIPEPSSALLFAAGSILLGRPSNRRRRG